MQRPAPTAVRPIDTLASLAVIVCCITWGVNQVAVKVANADIPPLLQAGLRSVLSAGFLWGWALWRGIPLFERDGTFRAGVAVGTLFAVDFLLLYPGLALTTASHGVLFLYAMPFFVAVGAHYLIPGDRLTASKLAGLVAAFAGLAIALGDDQKGQAGGTASLIGDLMCVAAGASWAASTIVLRTTRLKTISAEKSLFYQLVVSAPILIGASLAIGERPPSFTNGTVVIAFAYTVVVVAFMSYVLWFWLLTRYSASAVSAFTFLTPIFGAFAGTVLLGEPMTARLLTALALVAAGIYLVSRPRASSARRP
jgi:drug/metabolite transporter (DMT)-like permease